MKPERVINVLPPESSALHPNKTGDSARSLSTRLRIMQLASQALPTGAFAYSSGLESMHDMGHLKDEAQCLEYLNSLMDSAFVHLELPLFLRMRWAFQQADPKTAAFHSAYLLAARESRELQEQERQMGRSLRRVLLELHNEECKNWQPESFTEALAKASVIYDLSDADASSLLVYTWLEQQVSALCRMIPLGPIAGQRVLDGVIRHAPQAIEKGHSIEDEDIGAAAPQLALASALHETQYTRIFRS